MESALIVTGSDKSAGYFKDFLTTASITLIETVQSCAQARRIVVERDFDLMLINAPLPDESGESLARDIAAHGISQVILVVKNEYYDAVSAACENDGVLTVAKPTNKALFWSALMLAKSSSNRIKRMKAENQLLKQKIDDIRIVDRAKCILISHINMSEQEAHRYIEKQAMDMRTTKRAVAEAILKTYEM